MSEVTFLRKDDAQEAKRAEDTAVFLERMATMVRERKLRGIVVVGVEIVADDIELEAQIHRTYATAGVLDTMTLIGAMSLVKDEIKDRVRGEVTE